MFFKNSTHGIDSQSSNHVDTPMLILVGVGVIVGIGVVSMLFYCLLNHCWKPKFSEADQEGIGQLPGPYHASPGSKIEAITYTR